MTGTFDSVFGLALEADRAQKAGDLRFQALDRIISISCGHSRCIGTPNIAEKYGLAEDTSQLVVCIQDRVLNSQVWWNATRTKKPQTFRSGSKQATLQDPTDEGKNCDFCRWKALTAMDTFGRVEGVACVTASNLFKYAFPCHGLVLFKHHNPLQFSADQISDMLSVSHEWFRRAYLEHPFAEWPLFIWNCLPRAGASQFHGHAQVVLTSTPTPAAQEFEDAVKGFARENEELSYFQAVEEAYQCVNLCRTFTHQNSRAFCFASLAPAKDMEMVVVGESLRCKAFSTLLHGCLRALIDQLAVTAFNVSILNISVKSLDSDHDQPIIARLVSRGSASSQASDYGGLEVFGRASIGHTDPNIVIQALDLQMADLKGYLT